MEDSFLSTFVETSSMRSLREAIEAGRSPIFLSGMRGAGKTAMLYALMEEWLRLKRPVAYVNLSARQTPEHIIEEVVFKLGISNAEVNRKGIVSSSSSSSEEAWFAALNHLQNGLIILDDLESISDRNRGHLRLIRQLIQTGVIVVAASRPMGFSAVFLQTFSSSLQIQIAPWTFEEFQRFLPKSLAPSVVKRIGQMTGGNPRVARLLLAQVGKLGGEIGGEKGDDFSVVLLRDLLKSEAGWTRFPLDELLALMARLAVSGPVGLFRSQLSPEEATVLQFSTLVRTDVDTFRLADYDLARDLLKATNVLPSIRPADLVFGAEEAERDALLAGHFLPPPGLDELRNGRRNIVVGDRGAGKSALFSALANGNAGQGNSIEFVRLEDPSDLVLRLESNGKTLGTAEQFRAAWLLSLACTIATQVRTSSVQQEKLARRLRDTIPMLSAAKEKSTKGSLVLRKIRSIWREARGIGVKFQFGPVTLESPKSQEGASGHAIDVSQFLRETTNALRSEGRRVLVAVDRIDEVHKYERTIQEPLVQGLFLAESGPEHGAEIGFLIFIRTDLFETYDIQEKNKLVTRQLLLRWKEDALLRMTVDRVFSNQGLAALGRAVWRTGDLNAALPALFPREIEGKSFEDWLWLSLRNGNRRVSPRQLILLLALARDAAIDDELSIDSIPVFSESMLRSAMTRLSELSFIEATNDFRAAPTFLRSLRAGKVEEFSLADVGGLFAQSEGEISFQVEALERLGIIERLVMHHEDGSFTYRLRMPPLYTRCWKGHS